MKKVHWIMLKKRVGHFGWDGGSIYVPLAGSKGKKVVKVFYRMKYSKELDYESPSCRSSSLTMHVSNEYHVMRFLLAREDVRMEAMSAPHTRSLMTMEEDYSISKISITFLLKRM